MKAASYLDQHENTIEIQALQDLWETSCFRDCSSSCRSWPGFNIPGISERCSFWAHGGVDKGPDFDLGDDGFITLLQVDRQGVVRDQVRHWLCQIKMKGRGRDGRENQGIFETVRFLQWFVRTWDFFWQFLKVMVYCHGLIVIPA